MGIADKLGLTKHSIFIAKVHIEELTQVPLVNAKFRVKWKFKTATSAAQFGLEGDSTSNIDEVASFFSSTSGGSGAGRRFLHPLSAVTGGGSNGTRSSSKPRKAERADSPHFDSAEESSSSSRPSKDYIRSMPMSPPHSPPHSADERRTPNPNRTPTAPTTSTFAFTSPFSSSSNKDASASSPSSPDRALSPYRSTSSGSGGGAPLLMAHSSSGSGSQFQSRSTEDVSGSYKRRDAGVNADSVPAPRAEPKGTTTFIPLRAHTVTIKREVVCAVAINLKATGAHSRPILAPAPLRLAIRQEVLGDDGKKEEVKAGEVVLDLAQFVGSSAKGEAATNAPRRYLLRESKTNATLRVSVEMEWVGGDSQYVAPPLKTGQIANSSSASIASTPAFNRSSSSVNSRRPGMPTPQGSFVPMSRTNSSSSVSSHSHSLPSMTAAVKPKGWRPTSSPYSASPAPPLLGGTAATATDFSASTIIDSIFNRPPRPNRQGSYSGYSARPLTPSNGPLNFSASSKSRSGASTNGAGHKSKTLAAPISLHSSNSTTFTSAPNSRPGTGSAPAPPSRPLPYRPPSSSSSINSKNQNRSVRWGDDTAEGPTNSSSLRGSRGSDSSLSSSSPYSSGVEKNSRRSLGSYDGEGEDDDELLYSKSHHQNRVSSTGSASARLETRSHDDMTSASRNGAGATSSGIGSKGKAQIAKKATPSFAGSSPSGSAREGPVEWQKSWG